MLIQRHKEIIQLLKQYDILSSRRLAEKLHVSSKTIRNDINHINSLYAKEYIISIKGAGYSLIKDFPLDKVEKNYNITQENIQFLILKKLLETPRINFYELADQLYISEANLQKKIYSLNEIIHKRNPHVDIKRDNNMIYINGNEEEKRQITTYFLINELNQYNLDISQYQSFVEGVNIKQLEEYVVNFNQEYHLGLRDLEILSLVVHVSLMLERILQGNKMIGECEYIQYDYDELADTFCKELGKWYDINFNEREINYVSTLFAGKVPVVESDIINDIKIFIDNMLVEVNDIYEIDLSLDDKFKDNILIHLLGLKNRIENHTFLNNPLMNDIKKNYPIIYDISVFIAMKIEEQFHTQLYEEEIGYITFHLMGSIERLHASSYKKIVILYPFGRAGLHYLKKKLTYIHDLSIEICDILSIFDYKKVQQYDPDLILSFFHIQEQLDYPVYVCHNMLDDTDIEDIYHILKEKKNPILSSQNFFEKDLFFKKTFQSKEQVIHFLCKQLLKKGYVKSNYEELVLARERIAPTAYGNFFAIPHAVKKEAYENKVAVCLLDKSILWNAKNVRIVFLFCLSKERNQEFDELFERLVKLLDDQGKVKKLLKTQNFEEFIKHFFQE